jgi:L-serine dehydratase
VLYASLALTGRGHATDRAVILGLCGFSPPPSTPTSARRRWRRPADRESWRSAATTPSPSTSRATSSSPAASACRSTPTPCASPPSTARTAPSTKHIYFSVGGGFVCDEDEIGRNRPADADRPIPYPFESGADLLDRAQRAGLSIAQLMFANEAALQPPEQVQAGLDAVFVAMEACIDRGMAQEGLLPGGLEVKRRARQIYEAIQARMERQLSDPLAAMDYVNLWALAVNEENAAGGRVVTAPTNGAAGLIPAVLRFYDRFHAGTAEGRRTFLLAAGAIGALYKRNASISGAEVGCQGEVGVACSMAAAGLAAALGGSNAQVENAAEIGMEHNLGLTCDPIGGLVQIPCIERNAMGAIKAIDAARLALLGDGQHSVSLDKVIATMKRTGEDMNAIYKETSLGGLAVGLAVNRVEC